MEAEDLVLLVVFEVDLGGVVAAKVILKECVLVEGEFAAGAPVSFAAYVYRGLDAVAEYRSDRVL